MRIDKFLKMSRIIKRRQIAKEFCDADKIQINDRIAKPGDQVKVGDKISIQFGQRLLEFEVISTDTYQGKDTRNKMVKEV